MKQVTSLAQGYKRAELLAGFVEVLESGQYSEGKFVTQFEIGLMQSIGAKHALAMSNCGAALYAAFMCLRIQRHVTKIAVQNNTFYASGAMAQMAGMEVFLVDSGPTCPSMGIESLKEVHQKEKVQAVVLTHVGGMVAQDYEKIVEYCVQHSLILIEDCAHAIGIETSGPHPGRYADVACWSFYPTKSMPVCEGGALTTNDEQIAEFVSRFRNYGKKPHGAVIKYMHVGMNLRMDEVNAMIGVVQLKNLERILNARYDDMDALDKIEERLFAERPSNGYKYIVRPNAKYKGVGKVYAWSDQLQHCLLGAHKTVSLKYSSTWAESHMCLPMGEGLYAGMSTKEVREAITA